MRPKEKPMDKKEGGQHHSSLGGKSHCLEISHWKPPVWYLIYIFIYLQLAEDYISHCFLAALLCFLDVVLLLSCFARAMRACRISCSRGVDTRFQRFWSSATKIQSFPSVSQLPWLQGMASWTGQSWSDAATLVQSKALVPCWDRLLPWSPWELFECLFLECHWIIIQFSQSLSESWNGYFHIFPLFFIMLFITCWFLSMERYELQPFLRSCVTEVRSEDPPLFGMELGFTIFQPVCWKAKLCIGFAPQTNQRFRDCWEMTDCFWSFFSSQPFWTFHQTNIRNPWTSDYSHTDWADNWRFHSPRLLLHGYLRAE